MNVTKEQWLNIAKIVLVALLAISAVLGYDLGVIQPREQMLQLGGMASRALGSTTRFTSNLWLQNSGMTIDKTLDVTGVSTLSGGMVGNVTGNLTGNVTGNISGSATSPVVTATTRITTPLITVNGAATVGSLSTTGDVSARLITSTAGITFAGGTSSGQLNMMNNPVVNVGAAGTDFTSDGGLTLATDLSARAITTTGYITVAGTSTFLGMVTANTGLDMANSSIANIGVAGTDFTPQGGLTLANDLSARAITTTGQITTDALYIGSQLISASKMMSVTVSGNNQSFAHSMSGTPWVSCTPWAMGLFTYTVYISATDATNVTVGIASAELGGGAPADGIPVSLNCVLALP